MSEETTAVAPATTTEVSTTAPAPAVETTIEAAPVQETESTEPDYSFVPKKFLKDGKPDFEGLTKSYSALEKKLGQKGLVVPEDVAEYEYTTTTSLQFDDELSNAFKADAQKAGLSKEQYAFVMSKYEEVMTQSGFNADASAQILKKDWGSDYQNELNSARRAFDEFAPSDISLDDPVLNHPTVVKLLARMGKELGEDSQLAVKGTASRAAGQTREDIKKIMGDKDYYQNLEKQAIVSSWYQKNS